ncbi:Protein of unknown function [Fontimonas thermophila]|uniref:Uncharacterized protein n=1 Tax=Fontimonas thermophila TaxID=1076937 RepID=A0A1I2KLP8_9GAMM|nr:DUF3237 domain-containing protein [Fontimonas thermophila]SFF67895.1 Protein of unknown function [Fontimonas thermophila]
MHRLQTDHWFSFAATLAPPEVIGPVAEGIRVNFWLTGGEARGPRIHGKLRAEGADFFTLRTDGVGVLSVRTVIETHDGALIDLAYEGLSDLGRDAYARFLAGDLPQRLELRMQPRLRSAHPAYADLARRLYVGVGVGQIDALSVSYDVYAIV